MIRIGVFGTDNSHSITFSRLFNVKGEKNKVSGAKVVAVYGLEEKRTAEVAEKAQIPTIVKRPQDALKMIDGAIVDFRHGSRHWKYAKMCIEAGIPTFIDKPLASSVADAKKIVALAKRKHVPITTFSTIKLGSAMDEFKKQLKGIGKVKAMVITGPGNTRDQYDGIFFYAVHQVELMLEAFGNKIKSVRGMDYDGMLVATVTYRNGMVVTLHEINTGWMPFMATAYGEKGQAVYDGAKFEDGYVVGAKAFTKMFRTGKMPYPIKQLADSVKVLAAIRKSMDNNGKEVKVK
jgi:predicted dehydrogenase